MSNQTAFKYRMPGGIAGDINRTHPASVEPCAVDASAAPSAYGQGVIVDATTQGVRPLTAGDTAVTHLWGITARPYPISDAGAAGQYGQQGFGAATPPANQPIDVMRLGYMTVNVGKNTTGVVKGAAVYIWCAASSGNHVQSGFEGAATGGSTAALDTQYRFNGTPDADGNVEIVISP